MKITLDLTEKELLIIETCLKDKQSNLWKWYQEEDSDMEKRAIDSEAVNDLCSGIYKNIVRIDEILEKLDDAEEEACKTI